MRFYLTVWRGTGTELDPFVPDLVGPVVGVIDLRPDPAVVTGRALVACSSPATSVPASAVDLRDETFASLPGNVRNAVQNAFGVTLTNTTLPAIIEELLRVHAGTGRWKALLPEQAQWAIYLGMTLWTSPVGG